MSTIIDGSGSATFATPSPVSQGGTGVTTADTIISATPNTSLVTGSTTPGTYTNSGASVTLTPGTWDIKYSGLVSISQTGTGQILGLMVLRTTTGVDSTGYVTGSQFGGALTTTSNVDNVETITGILTLVVSTTTTYYSAVTTNLFSSTPTVASVYADGRYGAWSIIATRRAGS